jgi:Heavy-metal resistance
MSPFVTGALGALTALVAVGLLRRVLWFRRLHRWRGRGRFPLRRLFARLGVRPEQEAVLSAEAEALWKEAAAFREDAAAARADLAELFSAEALDAATVSAALERRLERLGALRARAAEALARVHATLDAGQRERLVALLQHGPFGHGHCGRHGHAHARI